MTKETEGKDSEIQRCDCGRVSIVKRGKTPLYVDCYHKAAQADFIEQQILHNQMSWNASNINFLEQQLYIGHGGILPLKQKIIPPPLTAPNYSFQEISVSKSNIGAINTGTLINLDTSIQVIQNHGEKQLAKAIKELTQAVLDSNDINNKIKTEIVEQLEFLITEALASKEKQRRGLAKKVIDNISQSISVIASLLTIWNTLKPILLTHFGS